MAPGLMQPEDGYTWWHVPPTGEHRLTISGPIYAYRCHYVRLPRRKRPLPVRCRDRGPETCPLCAAGNRARVRYVFPIRVDGQLRLLELGRNQFPALEEAHNLGAFAVVLVVSREIAAANGPITARCVGSSILPDTWRVDLEKFVERLHLEGWRELGESSESHANRELQFPREPR